jgi:hypothetical protein
MQSAYGISSGNRAAQNPFTNFEEDGTAAAPAAARKSRLVIDISGYVDLFYHAAYGRSTD